jgi:hypothetical protein
MYIDGVKVITQPGQGQNNITLTESRFYALRVANTNVPANTPSYWTFAMVNTVTGAVVLRPEPGVWKTQEYSAS